MTSRALLKGSGIAVAPHEVTNDMLARIMETDDNWIQERSGIRTRFYADPGVGSSELGAEAARRALEDADLSPEQVDYVVCATMTPDHYFPGSGTLLQAALGMPPTPALDLRQQCAGFAYGLQVVDMLVRSGTAKTVLLVGCDVHSCLMPYGEDGWDVLYGRKPGPLSTEHIERNNKFRHLYVLFGDAAGAMVFQAHDADDGRGLIGARLYGDGNHKEILHVPGGGSKYSPWVDADMIERGDTVPFMDGRSVFKLAVTQMPKVTQEVLGAYDFTVDDLDLLIMHQANLRINQVAQKNLGLPDEKVHNNIQKYGNTTSATLPLAFHEAKLAGKAPEGSLVAFTALGAGLHFGSVLMRV